MSAQHTRAERLAIENLKARIADPQETQTGKTRARNELQRIRESAVARMKEHARNDRVSDVQAPNREDFPSDAEFERARELYRERLDEIACHKKLDSPKTGFYGREAAKKKLEEIHTARMKRGYGLSAPAVRLDAPAVSAPVANLKIDAPKKEGGLASQELIKQFEENFRMMKSEPPKPPIEDKPEPPVRLMEPKPILPPKPRFVTYPTASGGSIEIWEAPRE